MLIHDTSCIVRRYGMRCRWRMLSNGIRCLWKRGREQIARRRNRVFLPRRMNTNCTYCG